MTPRICNGKLSQSLALLLLLSLVANAQQPASPENSDHIEYNTSPAVAEDGTTAGIAAADQAHHNSSSTPDSPCLADPSRTTCAEYTYSDEMTANDLSALCQGKSYLSACSLFKLCGEGLEPASIGEEPRTCSKFQLLATACHHESLVQDEQACANYRALCVYNNNTSVQQCKDAAGLAYITPTAAALQLSKLLCQKDPKSDTCKRCDLSANTLDGQTCDIFSVYGELCNHNPSANECGPWSKMCTADPELYVCREQLQGGRPGPITDRPAGASGVPEAQAQQQQWAASSAAGVHEGGGVALLAGSILAACLALL